MRRPVRNLLLATASALAFVAAAEVGLRGLHAVGAVDLPRPRTVRDSWRLDGWTIDRDLNWSLLPGSQPHWEPGDHPINEFGLRSRPIPKQKPPGTYRVLVLGDSIVFGYAVSFEETFSQVLEANLRAFQKTLEVDVINAGVPGYSMYHCGAYLRRDGFDLQPDLVVIESNFNDRRYVVSTEFQDSEDYYHDFHDRIVAKERLGRSFLYRVMRRVLGSGAGGGAIETGNYDYDRIDMEDLHARVEPEQYRRELAAILDECERRGIPVMLVPIPDNPRLVEAYYRARNLAEAGDTSGALAALEEMEERPFYRIVVARERNRILESLGRGAEATGSLVPIDGWMTTDGNLPIALCDSYLAIQREAAERDAVVLADFDPRRHPDRELYFDHIHPNVDGHRLLGEGLFRTIIGSPEIGFATRLQERDP